VCGILRLCLSEESNFIDLSTLADYLFSIGLYMAIRTPIQIKFIGDISFNDAYIGALKDDLDLFAEVGPVLKNADLVVGNLECLAYGSAQNLKKVPRIGTEVAALAHLKNLNLGLVTLATNHYYDNLEDGFDQTKKKLKALQIDSLGVGYSPEAASQPYVWESRGWKVGFLNFVHPDTNPCVPDTAKLYANTFKMASIIEDIKKVKPEVDRVVVLLHWGGKCDYGYFPHQEQLSQANAIIDAGADAIIGHHTHTLQAKSHQNGKPIYFSLGNFCFADIECEDGVYKVRESGRKGGIVNITFADEKNVEDELIPTRLDGLKPRLSLDMKATFVRRNRLFNVVRLVPFGYSFYYYLLRRVEPVHYHAQLKGISMFQVFLNKIKRIIGLGW
jgi:poly-gamma-glutamate synthesis protein (capsule biosynthesis protein)